MGEPKRDSAGSRNGRTAVLLAGMVAGMVGLAFASVPLYRLFCQVTGYGGTTQVAETSAPAAISGERRVKVRFNADVAPALAWDFGPEVREVELWLGEPGLAYYQATNRSDRATVGTSTFNVTPLKAGQYFTKVQCFCFTEQPLEAGESARLGVSFYVDPALAEDPNLDDVSTITLSYTFFRDSEAEAERAGSLAAADAARGGGASAAN